MTLTTSRRARKPDPRTAKGHLDQAFNALDHAEDCLCVDGPFGDEKAEIRVLRRRIEALCRDLHTEIVEREQDGE